MVLDAIVEDTLIGTAKQLLQYDILLCFQINAALSPGGGVKYAMGLAGFHNDI